MTLDKAQRLAVAVSQLSERWGSAVLRPPQRAAASQQPHISSGFPTLDRALGIGGIPRGCISQFAAQGTAGLTTLALKIVAQAQQDGAAAAWLDTALTFDADYAVGCGVALERLLVVRSERHFADILFALVSSGGVGIIVCDVRGQDVQLPDTSAFSRIATVLASTECALLLICEAETLAHTHQAALRLKLERERWLMRGDDVSGYRVRVHILKNRFAPAGRKVTLTIGFSSIHGSESL